MKQLPTAICAMICITILELYALYQGINGVLLTTVLVIIAALAGIAVPSPFLKN
jgi:hypothetical protein